MVPLTTLRGWSVTHGDWPSGLLVCPHNLDLCTQGFSPTTLSGRLVSFFFFPFSLSTAVHTSGASIRPLRPRWGLGLGGDTVLSPPPIIPPQTLHVWSSDHCEWLGWSL
ncbi:MAG: hypothetical protein [Podoviridae sp. ctDWo9]|nr:MAG: hypothetical protein [Podoviridae sp. ctDWo9]